MSCSFHEELIRIRKERGLTQDNLAVSLNVTRQTVSRWENGLSLPDVEMLKKLSRLLQYRFLEDVDLDAPLEGPSAEESKEKNKKGILPPKRRMWLALACTALLSALLGALIAVLVMPNRVPQQVSNHGGQAYASPMAQVMLSPQTAVFPLRSAEEMGFDEPGWRAIFKLTNESDVPFTITKAYFTYYDVKGEVDSTMIFTRQDLIDCIGTNVIEKGDPPGFIRCNVGMPHRQSVVCYVQGTDALGNMITLQAMGEFEKP